RAVARRCTVGGTHCWSFLVALGVRPHQAATERGAGFLAARYGGRCACHFASDQRRPWRRGPTGHRLFRGDHVDPHRCRGLLPGQTPDGAGGRGRGRSPVACGGGSTFGQLPSGPTTTNGGTAIADFSRCWQFGSGSRHSTGSFAATHTWWHAAL